MKKEILNSIFPLNLRHARRNKMLREQKSQTELVVERDREREDEQERKENFIHVHVFHGNDFH